MNNHLVLIASAKVSFILIFIYFSQLSAKISTYYDINCTVIYDLACALFITQSVYNHCIAYSAFVGPVTQLVRKKIIKITGRTECNIFRF